MKRIVLLFFAVICLAANVLAQQPMERKYSVKEGDMAPDFTVTMNDGSTKKLSDLRGKVVMLQFTASWCSVCIKEMPHIESDIWSKHKNNKDFVLWGIMYKQGEQEAILLNDKTKVTYPLVYDLNGSAFDSVTEKGAGVTRNIIVDKAGKIACLTRGFDEVEFEKMKKLIDNLLEK